ncbi:MAG: hypothetical protein HY023_01295 [Chloroflexi bacterium]|nr:hypothetical protein [Chloroflexota bacterium]
MAAHDWWKDFTRTFRLAFVLAGVASLLAYETPPPGDMQARVSHIVGDLQFDFVNWTLDAIGVKVNQGSVAEQDYLPEVRRKQIVLDYLKLVDDVRRVRDEIAEIYTDPNQTNPAAAAASKQAELDALLAKQATWQPAAEAVLQEQIATVLAEQGFATLGQLLPPVSFHSTPLPSFLVVSRRDRIEHIANAEIVPGLTAEDEAALEGRVDKTLDVSSLVVPLGGIGTYPTMLYETGDINTVVEIGAHEWSHNYLTLRPLGLSYEASGELRTMNETTANIVGKEIAALVIARFYPERVPPPPKPQFAPPAQSVIPRESPAFNFNAEMRQTRVQVDALLAAGQVQEAEAFMEQRRHVFLEHGYQIRKINQAYFAFYGAYADQPGAGGSDPVGPAVTTLRERSSSLRAFVDRMSWMTSFAELKAALGEGR